MSHPTDDQLTAAERREVELWEKIEDAIAGVYEGRSELNPEERQRLFLLNEDWTRDIRREALDQAITCALEDATELSVTGGERDLTRLTRTLALVDLLAHALDGLHAMTGKEPLSAFLREILSSLQEDRFELTSVIRAMHRHFGAQTAAGATHLDS
jgi:hypothetical protein